MSPPPAGSASRGPHVASAAQAAASTLPPLAVVGAGRAGTALALALADAGAPHVTLVCRRAERRRRLRAALGPSGVHVVETVSSPIPAGSAAPVGAVVADLPLVCIATADRDIAAASAQLSRARHGGAEPARGEPARGAPEPRRSGESAAVWLHLSGVAPVDALRVVSTGQGAPAGLPAAALGSCHPLAAIADPLSLPNPEDGGWCLRATAALRGAFFAVDGEPAAVERARQIAVAVGGEPASVPAAGRAAYHAAASVVANDLVALLSLGEALCADAGMPPDAVRPALLHLASTALAAVQGASVRPGATLADGLTGAVGRGDAGTLSAHLRALAARPSHADIHRALSLELLKLVESSGALDAGAAAAVRATLER